MSSERTGDSRPTWTVLSGFLRRLFQKLGEGLHDAEDLAQESLARVVARPGGKPVSLGFAATVGRNLWRDRMRTRLRRGREIEEATEDLPDLAESPSDAAAGHEDRLRLEAAIAALDPRHRDAIVLVVLECRSYAEAARLLGVPRGTVKSRIHYGLQKLRSRLEAGRPLDGRIPGC